MRKLVKRVKVILGTVGVTALSLIAGTTAWAQAAGEDNLVIEEVTVTAQKRAQSLQQVPLAISVFSSAAIEETRIRELKEFADYIPNLMISQGSERNSQVTIRGVGAKSRNIGFDTRVGVYIDGIYLGQSPALNQVLLDLERIEVLRGPQGTLFGKNTVAGAISMVTRKPDREFGGAVSADIGNLGSRQFTAKVNLPLGDHAAIKISATDITRDGYVKNLYNGHKLNEQDGTAFRVDLAMDLTDRLSVRLTGDSLDSDRLGYSGEPITDIVAAFDIVGGAAGLATSGGLTPSSTYAPAENEVSYDVDDQEEREVSGLGLTVEYDLESGGVIRSITGYRDTQLHHIAELDYSADDGVFLDYTDGFEQLSQEFQYISPDDSDLTYVLGLYLYDQEANTHRRVQFGSVGFGFTGTNNQNSILDGGVKTKSVAGFINGEYIFSDHWRLGAGARYSWEEKKVDWNAIPEIDPNPFDMATVHIIDDRSDNVFTPTVSVSYDFNGDTTVYLRFAEGYKSGGYNLDFITNADVANGIEFDTESSTSWELGLRSALLSNRLNLNATAFYTTFDDYQVNQFKDLGAGQVIAIENAAKVITKGLELEATLRATQGLTFQATLGLLDATFDKFPDGVSLGVDADGNDLPFAPKFTYTLGAIYERPVFNDLLLSARLDYIYTDGFFTSVDNIKTAGALAFSTFPPSGPPTPTLIEHGYINAYGLLNGRISIDYKDRWMLAIWARNILDEDYVTRSFESFFGTRLVTLGLERTYGLEATYRF